MKYDGTLDIATGIHAGSKVWKNKKILWSEFVQKLSEENKTTETFKEYIALGKDDQSKIKDVGGYVGGYLRNGRRGIQNVVHRQLMTLDIDFAHIDFWEDFQLQFDNASVLHATHKHHESSPRYRLLIPLSRETSPDEYTAISRKIAGSLGIDLFDNTTFEVNRLMFWPSNPKDIDYYFRFQDGPFVDADEILDSYTDWTDSSLWPTATKHFDTIKTAAGKQEDPENKGGIVGAFCRTYTITEVIEKFLKDVYLPASEGRYTYSKGSTAAGVIIYEDKFAFSHHGTDPIGGRLCNSFDLVRIHLFGHLDSGDNSGKNTKSYKKMDEMSRKDKNVKKIIASENLTAAKYEFAEEIDLKEQDIDWMQELEINNQGKYFSSAVNINLIFSNDMRLKGLFKMNRFDGKKYIFGNMPWRRISEPEPIRDVDYSGIRNYIEVIYGISGSLKIDDALALKFQENSFHPVEEYLRELKWDGISRIDDLLIDYFGAEENIYTKEAIRKTLVGAVGRIFVPGIKFDLVLTVVGSQGCGKSTFFSKLGKQWFSDTFMTVQGKEALEQIQGAWIIEMAELAGVRKAEVEATKHFISKQEDSFRPAYARTSETYKRQCVFVATTNNNDFLRDPTGNRRFIPIDVNTKEITKSVFTDLEKDIDQIWAEAVYLFNKGEKLYMSNEAEELAIIQQRLHSESDERKGLIENYLDRLYPPDWDEYDIYKRKSFINDEEEITEKGKYTKDFVCVAEIWCECLGKEKEDMDRYKTRNINEIMKSIEGWEQQKSPRNFPVYGKQRYYSRIK